MNLDDIRRDARTKEWFASGKYWGSRYGESTCKTVGDSTYFVSSEPDLSGTRLYTVRVYDATTGDISSASTFQQFASRSSALGWLSRIAVSLAA